MGGEAFQAVADLDRDVGHAGTAQVFARRLRQLRIDLDRPHVVGMGAEQCGHVAGAGADFQHVLVLLHRQRLQGVALDDGREHAGTRRPAERNLRIGKGQPAMGRRHELFALDHEQYVEHVGIQHLAGTQLLLDHVEAGLFEIHDISGIIYISML
jgi:hypothetical protein